MPLTRSFKDTVKTRAARDPVFRDALLTEAADQLLDNYLRHLLSEMLIWMDRLYTHLNKTMLVFLY